MMSRVLVPIATGFEEIEAITIIDVLRRADIEVITAGLDRKCVKGAHGIQIKTEMHIDDVKSNEFDMIVLPGGMPGSMNLKNSKKGSVPSWGDGSRWKIYRCNLCSTHSSSRSRSFKKYVYLLSIL